MASPQAQIISLEVSPFDYDDYCNLFETYNNDDKNIELIKIIDCLGFNIDRPNGVVIASKIAADQSEIDTYMKDAVKIMKLGLWTYSKYSKDRFESEMTSLFNYSCKINYQIKHHELDEIITIRRIYTMSSRLGTVQMLEFILETDENSNTLRNLGSLKTSSLTNTSVLVNNKRWVHFDITKTYPNNLIVNKYKLACNAIYDFYIEKDFEEIDDEQMWEHELFQTGLHIV